MARTLTLAEWLAIVQFVLTAGTAVLVWLWRRGRESGGGDAKTAGRFALLERRVEEIERRMDHAGRRTSDLSGRVQSLPDRVRADLQHELHRIWEEIRLLRAGVDRRAV